jgi:SAM-dependent methyltransferase
MDTENSDYATVASFGDEWERFDQSAVEQAELQRFFDAYFHVFPWQALPPEAQGFDMGCGSGRWANLVAPRVGRLHCIDPSRALAVARRNLRAHTNIEFHAASVDTVTLPGGSQDFGYSLGVLHHIPDTEKALQRCVALLKPGAPLLLYLYYRFDNRPWWFRAIWKLSDLLRRAIFRLPDGVKHMTTDALAALVYWPLARLCRVGELLGFNTASLPLYAYRAASFYTMRTDSRDRFGTPLEQRFTRTEMEQMMYRAGLSDVRFSESAPYWCAVGIKA